MNLSGLCMGSPCFRAHSASRRSVQTTPVHWFGGFLGSPSHYGFSRYKWSPPWLRKAPWLPWLPPSFGLGKSCLRRPGRHHSPWAKHLLGCLASKVQQIQNSGSEPMPGCLLWVKLKHRSDKHHYFRCSFYFSIFLGVATVSTQESKGQGPRPKARTKPVSVSDSALQLQEDPENVYLSWFRILHPNYS